MVWSHHHATLHGLLRERQGSVSVALLWPTEFPGPYRLCQSHLWVCSCGSRSSLLTADSLTWWEAIPRPSNTAFLLCLINLHWNSNNFGEKNSNPNNNNKKKTQQSREFETKLCFRRVWNWVPSPTRSTWQVSLIPLGYLKRKSHGVFYPSHLQVVRECQMEVQWVQS